MFHGGGGFIHSEVYNMPTWMRTFHIQKINEHTKEHNDRVNKATKGVSSTPNNLSKPNIKPSSTYNFKK